MQGHQECADHQRPRRYRKKAEMLMLFAHLKRILKFDRLRLLGLSGAEDEFLMAAYPAMVTLVLVHSSPPRIPTQAQRW